MIAPTLFDLAAIAGLRPDGDIPNFPTPDAVNDAGLIPDTRSLSFDKFMENNRGIEGSPVTDQEHVAFLFYWLCKFAFCSKSLKLPKSYIPVALAIHKGQRFSLGRCLLATLYSGLNDAYVKLKKGGELRNFYGPLWLLQLWLNAVFAKRMTQKVPNDVKTSVEGYRLAYFSAKVTSRKSIDRFREYMRWFFHLDETCADWAPFYQRTKGPSWFVGSLVKTSVVKQNKLNDLWLEMLSPSLIYTLPSLGGEFAVFPYNPNFCARQFGLVKEIPTPHFGHDGNFIVGRKVKKNEALRKLILEKKGALSLELFDFKPC